MKRITEKQQETISEGITELIDVYENTCMCTGHKTAMSKAIAKISKVMGKVKNNG